MTNTLRRVALYAAVGVVGIANTVPSVQAQQTAPPAPVIRHHSKLKGAIVGAAAGHVLGGHAKTGAVAGALWQHHKIKKAALAK